jgi:hypothetical protein
MRIQRHWAVIAGAAAIVAAAAVATSVAFASGSSSGSVSGSSSSPDSPGAQGRAAGPARNLRRDIGLAWFRARPTPAGWHQVTLPGGGAVLSSPPLLSRMAGDKGTVSEGLTHSGRVLLYLNVTPRQGGETLSGWARFRVGHLTDDDASSARLDGAAEGLKFRGGQGSCVIDDYITKVHANHYREIACFVRGARTSSVLVAATPAADWARYAGLLEEAVDSYTVR